MTIQTEDYQEAPVGRMAQALCRDVAALTEPLADVAFRAIGQPLLDASAAICRQLEGAYQRGDPAGLHDAYQASYARTSEMVELLADAQRLELLAGEPAIWLEARTAQLEALFRFLCLELEQQLAGSS